MNPSALKKSVQIETKVVAPVDIHRRKTGHEVFMKHWAVSPPQSWLKSIVQRADHYQLLFDDLIFLLKHYGLDGGCVLFHPWSLSADRSAWNFHPHFHVVGHGYLDNMRLRSDLAGIDAMHNLWFDDGKEESWVIKQIHPDDKMRSIRYTFAYILTHAGLGKFGYDNDWELDADDLIIPAELAGNKKTVKLESKHVHDASRSDEQLWRENYSAFDWIQWTKERCSADLPVYRYFGSSLRTRVLGIYSDRRVRSCPVCGKDLIRKSSISSPGFVPAEYVHKSKIRVLRSDFDEVSTYWNANQEAFSLQGLSVMEFAMNVPHCSSPETSGMSVHRPSVSVDDRAVSHNRVLVYLWAEDGFGLDPVIVDRSELDALRKSGRVYDYEDRDVNYGSRVTVRKKDSSTMVTRISS